ncbi:MAG TPA: RagB/SusD family nutrient uptake outer membrane protein [Flavobacteriaceae bacterium]
MKENIKNTNGMLNKYVQGAIEAVCDIISFRSSLAIMGTVVLVSVLFTSCEDFVDIEPPSTEIVGASVYSNNTTAEAALMGIYSDLIDRQMGIANGGPTLYGGLSADEFINFDNNALPFFENALIANNNTITSLWSEAYQRIHAANSVIEGLENSSNVSTDAKSQLKGEALFIRAFIHFYLVNFWGDIPYITTTDFQTNTNAPRTSITDVYQNIVSDLTEAKTLLANDYNFANGERGRVNSWAATALLSRVYLYMGDSENAETQATTVINNSSLYNLESDLNNVFLANSSEAIWQLAPIGPNLNTIEGYLFIPESAPPTLPSRIALSDYLLNDFESTDNRKSDWVESITVGTDTYYYPYKYKVRIGPPITEYYMVLRLAEQYLIRAEARALQSNIAGAQSDLNTIRNRAGLPNTTANDQSSLLLAIEHERRIEFFAEFGHRWLDLKRTNRADAILAPIKADWQSTDALYPIPEIQITNNPNTTQNEGY